MMLEDWRERCENDD